jgi:hypothetical protein
MRLCRVAAAACVWSLWFLSWSVLGASLVAAEPAVPPRESVLNGLRGEHPRLLATSADFAQLQSLCHENAAAQQWLARLRGEAEKLLAAPPVEYEIPDGKRLLAVSRRAKDRILLLGLMDRLAQEQVWSDRLWREADAVTRFKDWNPSHFLDTAEMTFAVSIAYDWLYDRWTAEQREQLRRAIVELGLRQSLPVYQQQRGWSRAVHNWNQVCNGGMATGALALAEDEPSLAAEILHAAATSLPRAMHEFRPDGGWGEGPGYWRYATEYNVYFLAALRTALGTDFGLAQMPGFGATGDFPIHIVGPSGETFNYADAGSGWSGAPQLFWLATVFDQPLWARAQLSWTERRLSPLDLLWGAAWLARESRPLDPPLDRHFQGISVVTLRSAWHDPRAVFLGFKGGDNRVNHAHLDLGAFVLEAAGRRWAIDLGPDDYNMPGYFGPQRWKYYRLGTMGHNTLTINHKNQLPSARAPIIGFASTPSWTGAIADLTNAYPETQRVWRGVAMIDRRRIVVQDEVEAGEPVDAAWNVHTPAAVAVQGNRATLTLGDDRLEVRILSPEDVRFEVDEVKVESPQRPVEGVRRLTAVLPKHLTRLRLVVLFEEPPADDANLPLIRALNEWPIQKP